MKTFTDPQERIKQVLILSISTSLLLIILIYTYWLHGANKESIEDSVQKDIRNISTMVNGLSELKKKELKALAIRLGQGPVFKGAVSTGHQMTIEDMLTGLLKKNKLQFAAILEGRSLKFLAQTGENNVESIKEISPSRFIGSTRVSLSEGQKGFFLVGQELSPEELTLWSEVTGAKFSLFDKNHKKIRSNSSEEVPWSDKGGLLTTISGSAYYSQLSLLKDTLGIQFFIDRPPYWQAFKKKRNSLFFLGSGLFLFGIILSMVIAKLLSGFINRHSDQLRESHPEYDLLITEIESLRDKKA